VVSLKFLGEKQVLRFPTPATKTCRWGPRSRRMTDRKARTKAEADPSLRSGWQLISLRMTTHFA